MNIAHMITSNTFPIKPKTTMGRKILSTYLVYDLVKKKKYVAQRSVRLTTFEEVNTDRQHTHTNYDGSEKLLSVDNLRIKLLKYYISKNRYNEMELRNMILKEIESHKNIFIKEKISVFKDICKRFDKCEKMIKMANVENFDNLNQANVAYNMLMKEYSFIITALMCEGGDKG